jgi:hypothetical protein
MRHPISKAHKWHRDGDKVPHDTELWTYGDGTLYCQPHDARVYWIGRQQLKALRKLIDIALGEDT